MTELLMLPERPAAPTRHTGVVEVVADWAALDDAVLVCEGEGVCVREGAPVVVLKGLPVALEEGHPVRVLESVAQAVEDGVA